MRLETALNASRSGLEVHGQAMSVISDNIANVETIGFKGSRARFGDLMSDYQGTRDSSTLRTGSGAETITIQTINQQGQVEFTGRALDNAIQGKGYFIVGDAENPFYTKAGNFRLDKEGNLVTQDGKLVLGSLSTTTTTDTETETPETDTLEAINLLNIGVTAKATTVGTLKGNLSSTSTATTVPANPETFNEIGASASAVSNISVYDSLGQKHNIYLAFFKTEANKWTANAYIDGADVSGGTAGKPSLVGTSSLTFTDSGTIAEANQEASKLAAAITYGNGAAAGAISIDLSSYTQTANPSQPQLISQDGLAAGSISSYEFRPNGEIYATLSSGSLVKVGSLKLANFANEDGLKRIGGTYFQATDAAGKVANDLPDTNGVGTIQNGALERSAVDLQNEFTEVIVIQNGYRANSQMINSTVELLRRTIDLMR